MVIVKMTTWRSAPCFSSFYASFSPSYYSHCSSSLVRQWWRRPSTVEMACCDGAMRFFTTSSCRARRARCVISSVFSPTIIQDAGATVVSLGGAYSLVRIFDVLTDQNVIDQVRFFLRYHHHLRFVTNYNKIRQEI